MSTFLSIVVDSDSENDVPNAQADPVPDVADTVMLAETADTVMLSESEMDSGVADFDVANTLLDSATSSSHHAAQLQINSMEEELMLDMGCINDIIDGHEQDVDEAIWRIVIASS